MAETIESARAAVNELRHVVELFPRYQCAMDAVSNFVEEHATVPASVSSFDIAMSAVNDLAVRVNILNERCDGFLKRLDTQGTRIDDVARMGREMHNGVVARIEKTEKIVSAVIEAERPG